MFFNNNSEILFSIIDFGNSSSSYFLNFSLKSLSCFFWKKDIGLPKNLLILAIATTTAPINIIILQMACKIGIVTPPNTNNK